VTELDAALKIMRSRQEQAAKDADVQKRYGHSSGTAHHVFAIMGVAGGAVAAASAAAGADAVITVVSGALAALGSGATAILQFEQRAEWHFRSEAAFRAIADCAENEIARVSVHGLSTDEAIIALNEIQRRLDAARSEAVFRSSPTGATGLL
jgi:hypothetical protein